ncbi:MAG: TlpA disulfide reductase family protein [Deltaproteobacteria bacterium]
MNQSAPPFTLMDINGRAVSLSSFKGKVVFIDFWASWCPPCKVEFPELIRLMERYNGEDVALLAVNVDQKRSHAVDFLKKFSVIPASFHLLLDGESQVIKIYNASAMPTSFILDKNGVVRHIHFGYRETDRKKWIEEIDTLLKQ